MIDEYVKNNPDRACSFVSLGQMRYLSTLKYIDGVVGNSSSGLLEVPTFKKGTINIGNRQKGRFAPTNVFHCPFNIGNLNKIYKLINNNFPKVLKFVFFLRYLLLIFFISLVIFIVTPMFFDYDKRHAVIKSHLEKNYNLKIVKTESIKFYPFPLAKIELSDVVTSLKSSKVDLVTKKLIIYKLFLN